ncbi:MAG: LD-carboxypeptidase, partial [Acidimicrobiales bacterium]
MVGTRIPRRLKSGDNVRVIAPSCSFSMISSEVRAVAMRRFDELGLVVSFGEHVEESDEFTSSSIESRVADLHAAFADKSVDAILTVIGGYHANQLLPQIDWSVIRANPKIFCGYSDITILNAAILAHTGLVTYSGPHYSSFGMSEHFEQTLDWFVAAVFDDAPIEVKAASTWSDDLWFLDQGQRTIMA